MSCLYAQNNLPTVAVLDFEARGLSQSEAATLTDRLATELGNTNAVILVERKQLVRILEEQGLQQSGCTTDECVAEVGQLLGVQFMISGSINKLGKTYTIDARMFSVETGANTITVSKTHKGKIDGLVTLMENIAWELVGLEKREKDKETVAVLDFEGRGISQMEAATLTDRFTSSLGKTEAVLLVARQEMNEILAEQGFEQKEGCTTAECAAEVGGLLGVNNIVKGSIGKVGETYTIDAQLISVKTGATLKTVNKTYSGKIDGLIVEIETMAWEIVDLTPPPELLNRRKNQTASIPRVKTKTGAMIRSALVPGWGQFYSGRKLWGYSWLGSEIALAGLTALAYKTYNNSLNDFQNYKELYDTAGTESMVIEYRTKSETAHDEVAQARDQIIIITRAMGIIWTGNVIHAFISGPKRSSTVRKAQKYQWAILPSGNQMQLRWEIELD